MRFLLIFSLLLASTFTFGDNYCSAEKDTLCKANVDFANKWADCGERSLGYACKTADCIKTHYPDLDCNCAGCFGEFASCAFTNCFTICARKKLFKSAEKKCTECALKYCGDTIATCTGIKVEELPAKE